MNTAVYKYWNDIDSKHPIILRSPHTVYLCFVWIWEQTAVITLYSINWLVFITYTVCLLRGTDWVFIYNSGYVFCVDLRTNSD